MKKLFLSLALIVSSAAYAQDASAELPALTPEQIEQQRAYFIAAGDQLATNLLQEPILAAWYDNASDEEISQFHDLCVQYAILNMAVYGQFAKNYNDLFTALGDLTNRTKWSVQINFVSNDLAEEIQTQQAAAAGVEKVDDAS